MNIYVDTSTLLSKYIAVDPYSEESNKLSAHTHNRRVGSYLTVIELFSTLSRIVKSKRLQIYIDYNKHSDQELVNLVASYILVDWDIFIPPHKAENIVVSLQNISMLMNEDMTRALQLSPVTKLKTLDNMHIAIASNIKEKFLDIEYFVTNDKEILNRRSIVKKFTDIEVVNPAEILELI